MINVIVAVITFGSVVLAAVLATLGWVAKKVSDHDAADCELKTAFEGLESRVGLVERDLRDFRAEVRDTLTGLENKMDQRFDRLGDKIDQALLHREGV